jgi:GPH family glycoside/pentoside/hexuronide:cation symporter
MTVSRPAGISRRVVISYALPACLVALPTIPVYIHRPALYGVEMALGLATTGLVLLFARLFDTVTDPIIGLLSDRYSFRGMHRKPWIFAGAIIAGFGMVRLLDPPPSAGGTYLLFWSVVLYGGWTLVAVPYMAWGAELSEDYNERTRITAWREGAGLLGLVGAGALTAGATRLGWSESDFVSLLAWVAVVCGLACFPLLVRCVPEKRRLPTDETLESRTDWTSSLHSLARNRLLTRLLGAWFLNGLANGIPAALFFIYLEHGLGAEAPTRAVFVLVYFGSAIAAIPMWTRISHRIGKHRYWCCSMFAAVAAFATVPWIAEGDFAAFGIVCVITGMALGADLSLPPSLQADVIDYDTLRNGSARAGIQFALWSMSTKLALAAAVGLALPAVEAAGFDPTVPTETGRAALIVIYSILPAVIKGAAIALIWWFPLTARKQAAIQRAIQRRGMSYRRMGEPANYEGFGSSDCTAVVEWMYENGHNRFQGSGTAVCSRGVFFRQDSRLGPFRGPVRHRSAAIRRRYRRLMEREGTSPG